jgi:tripartite-type tricarboxylate transporter receptor subunit TctC
MTKLSHSSSRRAGLALALACCLVAALPAKAQQPGERTVKIIVPYPPGSTPDALARFVGEGLAKRIGQTVVIENKPGAGGMIGAKAVSESAPDGNTLLLFTPAWPAAKVFQLNPLIPVPDGLEPVTTVAEGAFAFMASGKFAPRSFEEFVAHAKANPGAVNFATTGLGDNHMYLLLMQRERAFKMEAVQYKGSAEFVASMVAGDVQVAITPQYSMLPLVKDGRLKVLAVSGDARSKLYPEAPTFKELGIQQIRNNWFALFAPRNTPAAVVSRINADLVATIRTPEVSKRIQDIYFEPVGNSAEQLRQRINADISEWTALARAAGLKPE